MSFLKSLPLSFTGELHDVVLVNFSVELKELQALIPDEIAPRLINGRALISMVHVNLRNMRCVQFPFPFAYKHVAFRLLVDDSLTSKTPFKGIYFLRSFTNKKWIARTGQYFTSYNLETAQIEGDQDSLMVQTNDEQFISYSLEKGPETKNEKLFKEIKRLDRAYSVNGTDVRVTKIQRDEWPIEPIGCKDFKTNIFKTARLEGVFKIHHPILYKWCVPETID